MRPVLSSPVLSPSKTTYYYICWAWFCRKALNRMFHIPEFVPIRVHAFTRCPHKDAVAIEIAYSKHCREIVWRLSGAKRYSSLYSQVILAIENKMGHDFGAKNLWIEVEIMG